MGRQQQQQESCNNNNNNNTHLVATHSSIALLQQRFRELERSKEMREQRELLRLFPESERIISAMHYNPYFVNPELSLCLSSPSLQHKKSDCGGVRSSPPTNPWQTSRATKRMFDTCDNNEVDTSLHL